MGIPLWILYREDSDGYTYSADIVEGIYTDELEALMAKDRLFARMLAEYNGRYEGYCGTCHRTKDWHPGGPYASKSLKVCGKWTAPPPFTELEPNTGIRIDEVESDKDLDP